MSPKTRATSAVPVVVALLSLVALLPAPAAGAAVPGPAASVDAGTVTFTGDSTEGCPASADYDCSAFQVSCAAPNDDVADIAGRMAVGSEAPGVRFKGVLMFFVGNDGMEYWGATEDRRAAIDDLRSRGYRTIEVAWSSPYAQGTTGYRSLSCRPAAVVEWGADLYEASGARPPTGDGVCGFCLIGTSAGTAQVAYSLVYHGLGDRVHAAIEVSGPVETDLVRGCDRSGTDVPTPYQYLEVPRSPARARIDGAWDGGSTAMEDRACEANPHLAAMEPAWAHHSLLTGEGAVHEFPTTRWHFIFGTRDPTGATGQAIELLNALHEAGTPVVHHDCMNGGHELMSSPKAIRQLRAAIEWKPSDGADHPAPLPAPTMTPRCTVTRG